MLSHCCLCSCLCGNAIPPETWSVGFHSGQDSSDCTRSCTPNADSGLHSHLLAGILLSCCRRPCHAWPLSPLSSLKKICGPPVGTLQSPLSLPVTKEPWLSVSSPGETGTVKLSLLPLPANRPASRAHHSLGTSARVAPITSSSTSAPRSSDEPPNHHRQWFYRRVTRPQRRFPCF